MAAVQCGTCGKWIPLRPNPNDPMELQGEKTQTFTDPVTNAVDYICLECLELKKAEALEQGGELVEQPG